MEEPTERLGSAALLSRAPAIGTETSSDSPLPALPQVDDEPPRGSLFGRYVVLGGLGAGGMGVVYSAYDPELNRRVALKVMRPRTIAAGGGKVRMLREAQALARLSHPNVVAIYDVGTLDDRVFLAMELVDGMTLSAWLKQARRPWREIVTVFCAAGRGLAAAHAAGLIHRDFKPANVLVGNDGRIRVMDFGLARADGEHEDEADPHVSSHNLLSEDVTMTGTLMGTPLYMSPEAHRGQMPGETSDQFGFCVALYSALYQRAPFDTDIAPDKPERWVIREPTGNVPRWIADIVRNGLAKEPEDRHPSMSALIARLERDPRRKRWTIAATAGALAIAAAAVGAHSIRRHRALAACEADGASIDAVWNAQRSAQIGAAFAASGLSYATETWGRAKQQLDEYAGSWQKSRTEVCKRSTVEGSLAPKLARSARSCLDEQRTEVDELLAQLAVADRTTVERAAAATASMSPVTACTDEDRLRHQPEPASSVPALATIAMLRTQLAAATAAFSVGRVGGALHDATSVVAGAKAIGWQPLVLDAEIVAGEVSQALGQYDGARTLYEDAYFLAGASGRDDLAEMAATRLAYLLGVAARKEGADVWLRTADMLAERLGNHDDVQAARLASTHGEILSARGDAAKGQPFFEHAIDIRKRVLGDSSPDLATAIDALARVYSDRGELDKAVELGEQALAIRERVHGPNHPAVALSLGNLAVMYGTRGDLDKSFELHQRALALREKLLPPDHLDIAHNLVNLANSYGYRGKLDKTVELATRALDIFTKRLGPDSREAAAALRTLSHAYSDLNEYDKAIELGERALAIQERALGSDHPDIAQMCNQLSDSYASAGKYDRALAYAERAHQIFLARHGADHFMTAISEKSIAAAQVALHRYKEALDNSTHALATLEKRFGPTHPGLAEVLRVVGDAKMGLGKPAEAREIYEREMSLELPMIVPPDDYAQTQFRLARALWDSGGDKARAKELAQKAAKTLGDGKHEAAHKEVTAWLASRT